MKTIKLLDINGNILFEHTEENNTIKRTVEAAIKAGASLKRVNLRGANLRSAILYNADLVYADFTDADLTYALIDNSNCKCANFNNAALIGVSISNSCIRKASFRKALIENTHFNMINFTSSVFDDAQLNYSRFILCDCYSCTFKNVSLNTSYFWNTNLTKVDFSKAEQEPYILLACPSHGAFIGWKTVRERNKRYLIKLLIPEDAKRSSATTNKCRCDKAKVLSIEDLKTNESVKSVINKNQASFLTYKVGEFVYPDSFDENRWNECSNGIHFFINKSDAINYYV